MHAAVEMEEGRGGERGARVGDCVMCRSAWNRMYGAMTRENQGPQRGRFERRRGGRSGIGVKKRVEGVH